MLVAAAMLLPRPAWVAERPLHPSVTRVVRRVEAKRDWVADAALCPADVAPKPTAIIEPGENHWHGAAPTRLMTHVAMQLADESGSAVAWGRHVSDDHAHP